MLIETPRAGWREKWANAVNIKFPRDKYEKLKAVETIMECEEWSDMADDLYNGLVLGTPSPKLRELMERALAKKVYKI